MTTAPNGDEARPINARLYATFIAITAKKFTNVNEIPGALAPTDAWREYVEKSHRVADCFIYQNIAQPKTFALASFSLTGHDYPIWVDIVLVRDSTHTKTEELRVHLAIHDDIDLADPDDVRIASFVKLLQPLYNLNPGGAPLDKIHYESGVKDKRFREVALEDFHSLLAHLLWVGSPRKHAMAVSRYWQASVACHKTADLDSVIKTPAVSTNIFRLLYLHASASSVDQEVAQGCAKVAWTSAQFYRSFHQPAGSVTLSIPYTGTDDGYDSEWFHPNPPTPPVSATFCGRLDNYGVSPTSAYDALPEYPPLRYLAQGALSASGRYEERVRAAYEDLVYRPSLLWIIVWPPHGLGQIRRMWIARNQELIRVPIVRELVHNLMEMKLQQRSRDAIGSVSTMNLAVGRIMVSIIAVVLTIMVTLELSSCRSANHESAGQPTQPEERALGDDESAAQHAQPEEQTLGDDESAAQPAQPEESSRSDQEPRE